MSEPPVDWMMLLAMSAAVTLAWLAFIVGALALENLARRLRSLR